MRSAQQQRVPTATEDLAAGAPPQIWAVLTKGSASVRGDFKNLKTPRKMLAKKPISLRGVKKRVLCVCFFVV
jgi:hypothetical protein